MFVSWRRCNNELGKYGSTTFPKSRSTAWWMVGLKVGLGGVHGLDGEWKMALLCWDFLCFACALRVLPNSSAVLLWRQQNSMAQLTTNSFAHRHPRSPQGSVDTCAHTLTAHTLTASRRYPCAARSRPFTVALSS
jgi:hypothetical protein